MQGTQIRLTTRVLNGFVCIVLCPPLHVRPCQVVVDVSAIVVRTSKLAQRIMNILNVLGLQAPL
jgi:hypothetical protein